MHFRENDTHYQNQQKNVCLPINFIPNPHSMPHWFYRELVYKFTEIRMQVITMSSVVTENLFVNIIKFNIYLAYCLGTNVITYFLHSLEEPFLVGKNMTCLYFAEYFSQFLFCQNSNFQEFMYDFTLYMRYDLYKTT